MSAAAGFVRGALEGALRALVALSVLMLLFLAIGPHTGLYRPVSVLSDSMLPTFSRGDLIISTPEPSDRLQVGQVVSFRIPVGDHRVESHRVIEILTGGASPVVRTQGDANKAPDPWNAQLDSGVVWVVSASVPKLGWLIIRMHDPRLRLLALFVSPALIALRFLMRIWLPGGLRLAVRRSRAHSA